MDHMDVGLRAAIRALSDVVAPAVDPEHAQARDQLRLAIDYLGFVAEHIDLLQQRRRLELAQHLAMGRGVLSALGGGGSALLPAAIEAGAQVLERPGASAAAVKDATAGLAAAVSEVVREGGTLAASVRREVELCVLHASEERIAFERSWYLPLRLDPDPHEVRALAEFLDGA